MLCLIKSVSANPAFERDAAKGRCPLLYASLMNTAQFYEAFLDGWTVAESRSPLKRLAGKTLKWKSVTPVGTITFAFATNSKTAGLLPHLPGEFRVGIRWNRKMGESRKTDEVSWFQYTTDEEAREFGALQRSVLEKFLSQPGKAGLREIFNYSSDPTWLTKANFDEFAYYFDAADANAWGRWYGTKVESWIARFTLAPESFNAWCWRVLWSDAKHRPPNEA